MSHKSPKQSKPMGRRELLKALAATGGAVTAAGMLPGKWSKPVVEAGVLPAHAQGSPVNFSLNARITNSGRGVGITGDQQTGSDFLEVEVEVTPAEAGIGINDEFTNGPFSGGDGPQTTDGSGVATFTYRLCDAYSGASDVGDQGECPVEDFELTYTFSDQGQYGSDSDSVSGDFDTCVCF